MSLSSVSNHPQCEPPLIHFLLKLAFAGCMGSVGAAELEIAKHIRSVGRLGNGAKISGLVPGGLAHTLYRRGG